MARRVAFAGSDVYVAVDGHFYVAGPESVTQAPPPLATAHGAIERILSQYRAADGVDHGDYSGLFAALAAAMVEVAPRIPAILGIGSSRPPSEPEEPNPQRPETRNETPEGDKPSGESEEAASSKPEKPSLESVSSVEEDRSSIRGPRSQVGEQYVIPGIIPSGPPIDPMRPPIIRDQGESLVTTLPLYVPKGKTLGVLRIEGGEVSLQSGWEGPAQLMGSGASGFDIVTRTHVEGHAAAWMNVNDFDEGVLYMNNPEICKSCLKLLPDMLYPGKILWVITPNGSVSLFEGGAE